MCTSSNRTVREPKRKKDEHVNEEDEYYQLEKPEEIPYKETDSGSESRIIEKVVFVLTSVCVVVLSHAIVWGHWALPWVFVLATPVLVGIRTYCYWKYKWQYFMIDFCYFVNTLTFIYLWFPNNEYLFRIVFSLANGPVLAAVVVYRNSLVYHHHDKIISCYIHLLPPSLTFCIRWFPLSTSEYWFQPFLQETPAFDIVWLYLCPFVFFFLHSMLYCLVVNVIFCPKEPYLTSYGYLAEKYDKLNCIGGKWGQGIVYYGLSWLFCLTAMLPALLAYSFFPVHCALLALVFLVALWNGGSYYVHVFSERGFNTMD